MLLSKFCQIGVANEAHSPILRLIYSSWIESLATVVLLFWLQSPPVPVLCFYTIYSYAVSSLLSIQDPTTWRRRGARHLTNPPLNISQYSLICLKKLLFIEQSTRATNPEFVFCCDPFFPDFSANYESIFLGVPPWSRVKSKQYSWQCR